MGLARKFGRSLRVAVQGICPILVLTAAAGLQPAAQQAGPLPTGQVIERVVCADAPEQSYALYLPSGYTASRTWPVLYAFDPEGDGRVPVRLMKDLAEQYGFILAGSNNSRNGPAREQIEAADAVWQDTHRRFAIDARRAYTTGFSGGARVAFLTTFACTDCIAGVLAQGAGLPGEAQLDPAHRFDVFATVGELDFNYGEMVRLAGQLDAAGFPNRLRRFDGSHQWAPADALADAFAWFELRAMAENRAPRKREFIEQQLALGEQRVAAAEGAGDPYGAAAECAWLVRDFDGLADLAAIRQKLEALDRSAAYAQGKKREAQELDRQAELVREPLTDLGALEQQPQDQWDRMRRIRADVGDIRHETRQKDASRARAALRALHQITVYAFEAGQDARERNKLPLAETYFQLAAEMAPDSYGPFYELARTYAAAGDHPHAIQALGEAIQRGLRDASLLRGTPEFAALAGEPAFQKLLNKISGN